MSTERLQTTAEREKAESSHPACMDAALSPLSFAQQRLWFLDQLNPGNPAYNILQGWRLEGPLNIPAFDAALTAVVQRHEALRTVFGTRDGQPVQIIASDSRVRMEVRDISAANQREMLDDLIRQEAERPFDLQHGPLARVTLFRLDPQLHVALFNLHHIIADGWSFEILRREFAAHYEALCSGEGAGLPELPIQYLDYAVWQREQWNEDARGRELAFWTERLRGAPPRIELPADHSAASEPGHRCASAPFVIARPLVESLHQLGRRQGATLFMVVLAAFNAFLQRITGQDDIVVGAPVSGRDRIETQDLIGLFVHTLALRNDLRGDPAFAGLLARVRESTVSALACQAAPFDELVKALQPERAPDQNPLFNVVLGLQRAYPRRWTLGNLRASLIEVEARAAKFDWTFLLEENDDGIKGRLEYNSDLFKADTILRFLQQFHLLLEGAAAEPDRRISELPLLNDAQRTQLLVEWNRTASDYERDRCIHELFELQAARTPDAIALVSGDRRVTYDELNRYANQLARRLKQAGVGPETRVGVCVERSPELIVSLLAILKAGGAYVPLDTAYPRERLEFMMRDAMVRTVIAGRDLKWANVAAVVRVDQERPATMSEADTNLRNETTATNLAYVIYTSGSTGTPKGAAIPHRGVVRLVRNTNYVRFSADDTFLQLAPVSFDASTFEIWGALLNGAQLVIFPPHIPSLDELGRTIQQTRVTVLWLTAGLFHQMVDQQIGSLKGVRQLLAGGDVLSVPHVLKAIRELPDCQIINGYGPTENTTFTCCYRIPGDWSGGRSVPIGKPISNTQVFILDGNLAPVPIGVFGELCISGDGLARGYLNQAQLTAETFVPLPSGIFHVVGNAERGGPGDAPEVARLYRTGDMARWLPDGTIEFLGRRDQQVKIRGFRVEPGEIEAALTQFPDVREATVIARPDNLGNRELIAYTTLHAGTKWDPGSLREFLERKLPAHMIPAGFVKLDQLPLTANGKVDRRALPEPSFSGSGSAGAAAPPRDALEEDVIAIWREVLGRNSFGVHENFFHLGGHSLLATQVVSRIARLLNIELPVRAVFEAPTVAQLAERVRSIPCRTGRAEAPISRRVDRRQARELLARLDDLSDSDIESLLQSTDVNRAAS